jgi:predicted O-methyltransferase YrrM
MHSPFVYDFITKVLNDREQDPSYEKVEGLRKELLYDDRQIIVDDFGAGSVFVQKKERSIQSITRNAAKPKKYGQLLNRIVRYFQPAIILELGTSLGITSSYLALGNPEARLITMEGAEAVAGIARQNFQKLSLSNIELVEGNFDDTLSSVLYGLSTVDLAFIDGNHREEPAFRYFEQILGKVSNDSILVFDDIHWSPGMEAAWNRIRSHTAVRCSIDLFFIGIIFFRKEFKESLQYTIRF